MNQIFYWQSLDNKCYSTTIFDSIDPDLVDEAYLNKIKPTPDSKLITEKEYKSLKESNEIIEQEAANVYKKEYNIFRRDKLLQQSDIFYIRALESKLPKAHLDRLKDYRQALRDITLQQDLDNIEWPPLPSLPFLY